MICRRVVCLALLACVVFSGRIHAASPNVVVILADDQGWGDLSVSGNTNLSTPNIDSLARDGATLDRFYVCPVCSPTRAEFLTGRYHPRAGVYSTSAGGERMMLEAGQATIADEFRQAGYATAAFGKWHNGMQHPYHPNSRGFDEYYGFCSGHWGDYFSPPLEHNGRPVQGDGFLADDLTNHAMAFIESHREQPFFVYLPLNIPHSPMQVPDRWWDEFKDKELEMLHISGKGDLEHNKAALAMCENIDWNVGRLLEKLDALALADDTIVVYFSDNGPNGTRWNGGMKGRKGSTDEGGVRSPFFIRWPGHIPKGETFPQIAGAIDLLPTLTGLCGVERADKRELDGRDLSSLLLDEKTDWKDRLIVSHWKGRVSVRSQRYRLDFSGKLYDMVADPGQTTDVAKQHPDITAELNAAADAFRADVLAGMPKNDDRPFGIGSPNCEYTQLPARDATFEGGIKRSNKFPNCSFLTNWTNKDDRITWDAEVNEPGDYEVEVFYTCPTEDVGATFELSFGDQRLEGRVTEANDPPLRGMENDRTPRMESYVKAFKPLKLGTMRLDKGRGPLTLRAIAIPGRQVMDVRMLVFKQVAP